jgi:hypothetical protein
MATTNHVRVSNYSLGLVQTKGFEAFWKLTRALKKAGWKFKASSNGTTKVSNSNPASDNWGSGVTSNAGAAAASITVVSQGRATITGLTGIVATDKGRFLLISGAATGANNNQHQIEEVISSTSVRIDARNFAVAIDANNGSLTWSIVDPTTETYPNALSTAIAWWCGQGPSIIRIPFTSAASTSFIKGENIIQSTTLAEGELLGYTFSNGVGYLNVAPRVRGSGGEPQGWATANVVTGSLSGATLTQVGTALEYVYEVVIVKPTGATSVAQVLFGQFETVAESAELFSFCATQTGATATVHPGGGGTGNAFGAHAWVMWGTSSVSGAGNLVAANTSTFLLLNAQYVCVDAIPEQNYSADGSWNLFIPSTTSVSTTPVGGLLYGFNMLDNIEEGEISPYVTINPGGTVSLYTRARTNAGTITTIAGHTDMCRLPLCNITGITRTFFMGWRGRGVLYNFRAQEYFTEMEACAAYSPSFAAYEQARVTTPTYRMLSTASPYAKTREPIAIVSAGDSSTLPFSVKGTLRWLYWINGDQVTDIYGTDPAWTQLSSNPTGAMVVGPTDGTAWSLSL